MSKNGKTVDNYETQSLIAKTHDGFQAAPIFILCETCHWGATYFDKTRITMDHRCPQL
jgi:hypothetical protein